MKRRKWQGSKWCRPERRLAIYLRDDARCVYCLRDASVGALLTLDHVVPHVRGGGNEDSNLVTACKSCNSARQDRPVTEWYGVLERAYGPDHVAGVRKRVRARRRDLAPFKRQAKLFLAALGGERFESHGHAARAALAA